MAEKGKPAQASISLAFAELLVVKSNPKVNRTSIIATSIFATSAACMLALQHSPEPSIMQMSWWCEYVYARP